MKIIIRVLAIVSVLTIILISGFNIRLSANYDTFNLEEVKINQSTNSIKVSWGNIGDEYHVYLDGEFYVTTSDNKITLDNLLVYNPYEIKIEAKEEKELIDTVVIQTYTNKEVNNKDEVPINLEEGISTGIFTSSAAKVIFENVPNDFDTYTLYKDNVEIGVLKKNNASYVDLDVEPDTAYRYSIVGTVKLTKKEKEEITEQLLDDEISPDSVDLDEIKNEFELARSIKTLKENKANAVSAAIDYDDPNPGVTFVYTTFIPMGVFEYIPYVPLLGFDVPFTSDYHVYKGDDRGFDPYVISSDYRTRTWAQVNFPENRSSVVRFSADASATSGKHKETGKWKTSAADKSGMHISSKIEQFNKAEFTVYHDATNKLHEVKAFGKTYKAPGITYQYRATVYRTGSFQIMGYHDRAPNHEMSFSPMPGEKHIRYNTSTKKIEVIDTTWRPLFQDKLEGFNWLIGPPVYGQKNISEQGYWK